MFGWIGTGIHALSNAAKNLFTGVNKKKRQAIKDARQQLQAAQAEVKAVRKQLEAEQLKAQATKAQGTALWGKITNVVKSYWYIFAAGIALFLFRDYILPAKKKK